MTDPTDPPCVICDKRPAVADSQACWPCATQLDTDLAAIPDLAALLPAAVGPHLTQPLTRRASDREPVLPGGDALNLTVRSNDGVPVAYIPAVRTVREVTTWEFEFRGRTMPISHTEFTREPVVDEAGVPVLIPDGDQTGELGPWVMVARWTAQWAALRDVGEVGAGGIGWLRERLGWACKSHPDLAGFVAQLRSCVGGMRAILAVKATVVRYGNRCPSCQNRGTLWRLVDPMVAADDRRTAYINCSACPALFEVDDERVTGRAA